MTPAPSDPAPVTPNEATDIEGAHLLLAEDTLINQKLAVRMLRKAGYEVDTANDGREAVDMALAREATGRPYALVLMDMLMPVLDGYGATRELRDRGYTEPIVALTANAMEGDREKCIAAGCDEFATKPFQRDILLATIAEQIATQAAEATKHISAPDVVTRSAA